jgi:hypothetical protein
MKQSLLFLFLFTVISVTAQSNKDSISSSNKVTEGKNVVKLNLFALLLKNITVQYERAVSKKISVAATFRFMPKGSIPFKSSVKSLLDDPETERQVESFTIGNKAVMPEVRFYLGKQGALHGFYIGLFASIAHYDAALNYEYEDDGITKTIPLAGSINTFTGGFMLGIHKTLGKRVKLDWWLLGPNYGSSKGNITGKKIMDAEEQQSLRDGIEEMDIPVIKYTYEVDGNGATVNFKGPWAGMRTGICLGINF